MGGLKTNYQTDRMANLRFTSNEWASIRVSALATFERMGEFKTYLERMGEYKSSVVVGILGGSGLSDPEESIRSSPVVLDR